MRKRSLFVSASPRSRELLGKAARAACISVIERLESRDLFSVATGDEPLPPPPPPPPPEPARPNFIFVITDDQRHDAMGFVQQQQGAAARFPWLTTPNLDRLRDESVWVRNAFVTSALCSPSRASFLTGQYNHQNGVKDNSVRFPLESVTYASLLQQSGYDTGYFGKWHMGMQSGQRPGFTHSASYVGQGTFFNNVYEVNGSPVQTTGWVDDVTTDLAIDYLQTRSGEEPFAMVVGYKSPHSPHTPPERLVGRFAKNSSIPAVNRNSYPPYRSAGGGPGMETQRNYFSTVLGVDDNVGRLMDTLTNLQLDENTVLVFTSDNGYFLGDHGMSDKRLAYEESMRVPMLIRYPQMTTGGSTLDQQILNIDIAPTFLDLAGVPVPSEMQGKSFKPLLAGETTPWRTEWLYENYEEDGYPAPVGPPDLVAVRTDTAKLTKWVGKPQWTELYDLTADPYEMNNLYGKSQAAALQQQMLAAFDTAAASVNYTMPTVPPPGTKAKISFQPAGSELVPGYLTDSGLVFGARNGLTYGWSTSHTDAVFDRNSNGNQLLDTVATMKSGAKWEMAVPSGEYTVKVAVHDAAAASTNTINVEGVSLFAAQQQRAGQIDMLETTVVVTDGRLTIDNGQAGNLLTRVNFIHVSGLPEAPPPPPPPATGLLRVNFQPTTAPSVSNYVVDGGQTYGARNGQTYGWSGNHADAVFDRNRSSNQLLDTVVSVKAGGKWELAVPNGQHTVKVSVGDAAGTTKNNVWVEGVQLYNYQSLAANTFSNKTITVNVTDGKLTLGVGGATTGATRINYLEVSGVPIASPPTSPPPTSPPPTSPPPTSPPPTSPPPTSPSALKFNFQPTAAPAAAEYLIDAGQTYAARNGQAYGWSVNHSDAVFDRNIVADQALDTVVSVKAAGKWELAVPNGQYTVKVGVGDAAGATKNNVWIEGVQLYNYQSLGANTFSNKSLTVNVTDGKLTLGVGGATTGTTRINYIEVAGLTVSPPPTSPPPTSPPPTSPPSTSPPPTSPPPTSPPPTSPPPTSPPPASAVKVNFQPVSAPTVSGYLADSGSTFGARNGQSYGWTTSHMDAVFDRNKNANQLLDTVVAVKAAARWELGVANGTYSVKVGVGDAAGASNNNVYVEGSGLFSYQPLATNTFSTKTITVNVRDGRLTVGVGSAKTGTTRIGFIEVTKV